MTVQFKKSTGGRGIEWCDETRNVFGGCFHRCRWLMPDGTMAMCYAEDLAENGLAKPGYPHGFEHHYFRPDNIKALAAGTKPRMIFVDSMSDMFGAWVPEDQLLDALAAMDSAPQHVYQSLTKAAPQLLKVKDILPWNLWVGASSPPDYMMPTNGRVADFDGLEMKPANPLSLPAKQKMLVRTLDVLRQVHEASGNVTWMSAEPVSWDMAPIYRHVHARAGYAPDWVVIGAASSGRAYYQPDPQHIAALLTFFDEVGTLVFFKGNIKPMFRENDLGSAALNRWREDLPAKHPASGRPFAAVLRRQEEAQQYGWPLNTVLGDTAVDVKTAVSGQMGLF